MRQLGYWLSAITGLLLVVVSGGCGDTKRPIDTGLTSQVMQCTDGPHYVMNCAQMFTQYKREFHVGLQVLNKAGAQIHLPVHKLIDLDTLTAELMLYRQNLCQNYNSCVLTRREYVAEQRQLMQLQFDLRRVVGIAYQAGFAKAEPDPFSTMGSGTTVAAAGTGGFGTSGGDSGGFGTSGGDSGGFGTSGGDSGGFGTSDGDSGGFGTSDSDSGGFGTASLETGIGTAKLELRGIGPSPVSGDFEHKSPEGKITELLDVMTTKMRAITRGQKSQDGSQSGGATARMSQPAVMASQTASSATPVAASPTLAGPALRPSVEQRVAQLLARLTNEAAQRAPEKASEAIVLGNFPERDLGYETPFSRYLAAVLNEELSAAGTYRVVPRRSFRGLAVVADPKQPEALARAAGAQMVLHGEHTDTAGGVAVRLALTDTETSQQLAAAETTIPKALIPAAYPAQVANAAQVERNTQSLQELGVPASGTLRVKVWTDRGSGASYQEGEPVFVYLRVNQDCHVRLFYVDAAGQTVQIFPNTYHTDDRLRAQQEIVIPSEGYGFRFVVTSPFGVERVVAVVSEAPIPELAGQRLGGGRKLMAASVRGIVEAARALRTGIASSEPQLAWDDVMLTTLPQGSPS
jgi:hypothetical protein